MKNFFGIDVTDNKNNTQFDGECFRTRQIPEAMAAALDSAQNANDKYEKKAALPIYAEILYWAALIVGAFTVIGIAQGDVTIKQVAQQRPIILYIGGIAWVTVLFLEIWKRIKAKKVANSREFVNFVIRASTVTAAAKKKLGIPEKCKSIDVIAVKYKYKGEEQKTVNFNALCKHYNLDMYIFRERDNVCIADMDHVYEIPITSIRSMELAKDKVMFPNWNKKEPFNSGYNKKFKITANAQGCYFARYYKVLIRDLKGEYELWIPNYEQALFTEISGVRPDES